MAIITETTELSLTENKPGEKNQIDITTKSLHIRPCTCYPVLRGNTPISLVAYKAANAFCVTGPVSNLINRCTYAKLSLNSLKNQQSD